MRSHQVLCNAKRGRLAKMTFEYFCHLCKKKADNRRKFATAPFVSRAELQTTFSRVKHASNYLRLCHSLIVIIRNSALLKCVNKDYDYDYGDDEVTSSDVNTNRQPKKLFTQSCGVILSASRNISFTFPRRFQCRGELREG